MKRMITALLHWLHPGAFPPPTPKLNRPPYRTEWRGRIFTVICVEGDDNCVVVGDRIMPDAMSGAAVVEFEERSWPDVWQVLIDDVMDSDGYKDPYTGNKPRWIAWLDQARLPDWRKKDLSSEYLRP